MLARTGTKKTEVRVARNLDREMIRNSRFRFSRSVAERVLETGEPLLTESATEDPSLHGSRSILDLGRIQSLEEIFSRIQGTSAHDITSMAREMFQEEKMSYLMMVPD